MVACPRVQQAKREKPQQQGLAFKLSLNSLVGCRDFLPSVNHTPECWHGGPDFRDEQIFSYPPVVATEVRAGDRDLWKAL